MNPLAPDEITLLLEQMQHGDDAARVKLITLVYPQLKRLAAGRLRGERADHTLQPTALVHEAFVRLSGTSNIEWRNRAQFFGLVAEIMRNVLVDAARRRRTSKRGSGARAVDLDDLDDSRSRSTRIRTSSSTSIGCSSGCTLSIAVRRRSWNCATSPASPNPKPPNAGNLGADGQTRLEHGTRMDAERAVRPVTPEYWRLLKDLFNQALSMDPPRDRRSSAPPVRGIHRSNDRWWRCSSIMRRAHRTSTRRC